MSSDERHGEGCASSDPVLPPSEHTEAVRLAMLQQRDQRIVDMEHLLLQTQQHGNILKAQLQYVMHLSCTRFIMSET